MVFYWVLQRHHGLAIQPWDIDLNWSMLKKYGEHFKDVQVCPPPWPPPSKVSKGFQSKLEAQYMSSLSPY
jgi:hypothetical protein